MKQVQLIRLSRLARSSSVAGLMLLLTACMGGPDTSDLDAYMAKVETDAEARSEIEPIPAFRPYKAFQYAATAFRAPFEVPIDVKELVRIGGPRSDVEPDENRSKEFLEQFNLEALSMVGILEKRGKLWVLVDDGNGGVHRVTTGNFLGRNHGRIVEVSETQVSAIEIVSSGSDSWIERPRTIKLREQE